MANSLLTINMITREAVRLWKNSNAFIQNVDMQYDDTFAVGGAKIGTALRIRLPNDYTVATGPALSVQDTVEQSTTLVLSTQKNVGVSFTTVDRTMSLDDYSRRVLAPAVNNLVGSVAMDIMSGAEGGISNFVANQDANNNILTPNASTYLNAGASLSINSAPTANWKIVNGPRTEARVVASLSGLLNPQTELSNQYITGRMYDALGFIWMRDQTAIIHTTGSLAQGSATVNGAGQTGNTLTVNSITGTLNAGDVIAIAGVNGVNRANYNTLGVAAQFVVTAPVASGATSIPIYPAIIPPASSAAYAGLPYTPQQYQTVTASPANNATVTPFANASTTYRENLAYAPDAITLVVAPLWIPPNEKGVIAAARHEYDRLSMRSLVCYEPSTDQPIDRLDILFGSGVPRPEWIVQAADSTP